MLKKSGMGILALLLIMALEALIGFYTINRDFSPSRVIGVFSIYGYGVLMFYLCYASLAPFAQKRRAGILTYILIALTLFFSYAVFALDRFVIGAVLLAGLAGIFTALNYQKTALLLGLASAVYFIFLTASSFWNGRTANFIMYAAIFAAVSVYLRCFFPKAKKEG